jgi:hypothetical protein
MYSSTLPTSAISQGARNAERLKRKRPLGINICSDLGLLKLDESAIDDDFNRVNRFM